jgi:uncharacterized repeat protein (TIGR03803 family)
MTPIKSLPVVLVSALVIFSGTLASAQTGTVLYSFNGEPDGYNPTAGLLADPSGNLYGTTSYGGVYGYGTVFELSPKAGGGWTENVLHSFNDDGTDGFYPFAGLILDSEGNLYGTTSDGPAGATASGGTVFELMPAGGGSWTETLLYRFCSQSNCTDGFYPLAGLIFDAEGNLYGTTNAGGRYSYGTVFEVSPKAGGGWKEKVLHSFKSNGTDGLYPVASLIFDAKGNLYGTTNLGGVGGTYATGTVFELSPKVGGSWTEKILHDFDGAKRGAGVYPDASLIFDASGNLYSTARSGGVYEGGQVFELKPKTGGSWTEEIPHNFHQSSKDGKNSFAGLIFDHAGNLYGTTTYGGKYGLGTVFKLSPKVSGGWTEKVLFTFTPETGRYPLAGLILDGAGNLYGTTSLGGPHRSGTVFEITPKSRLYGCRSLH